MSSKSVRGREKYGVIHLWPEVRDSVVGYDVKEPFRVSTACNFTFFF